MKQSALVVHLFVCGGDLAFLHRRVNVKVFACLCVSLQHVPSSFVLSCHLSILFPHPSFTLPPSPRVCVCVYVHLPVRVCDSCSLFVYIRSALHIYKAERFTLNPTLNASPSFPIFLFLPSPFLSCFHFFNGHFSHNQNRREMYDRRREQKYLVVKERRLILFKRVEGNDVRGREGGMR